jgi:hypothetical protein
MTDLFDSEYEEVTETAEESASTRLLGSPSTLLWAAASLVISLLLLLTGGIALHLLGYIFACLIPFTLVALFRRSSIQRMAISGIAPPEWTKVVSIAIIVTGFFLALVHAWFIASGIA